MKTIIKYLIILCGIFYIYILFISNALVRIKILNNTNYTLYNIKIFTSDNIIKIKKLKPLNNYNIVFHNKKEVNHKEPISIQYELESKLYKNNIYPYIEINDSYFLYIKINKNGKVEYNGSRLLFSIDFLNILINYWYQIFPLSDLRA